MNRPISGKSSMLLSMMLGMGLLPDYYNKPREIPESIKPTDTPEYNAQKAAQAEAKRQRKKLKKSQQAYTLVELLVVMGVLGMLAIGVIGAYVILHFVAKIW